MRDRSHEKNVAIKKEIHEQIAKIANKNRRSIKETISIILEEYIERNKDEK